MALTVQLFAELTDGARVALSERGDLTLSAPAQRSLGDLRADLRELVFEDELAAVEANPTDAPADRAAAALAKRGVDPQGLHARTFVIELDEAVASRLRQLPPE